MWYFSFTIIYKSCRFLRKRWLGYLVSNTHAFEHKCFLGILTIIGIIIVNKYHNRYTNFDGL